MLTGMLFFYERQVNCEYHFSFDSVTQTLLLASLGKLFGIKNDLFMKAAGCIKRLLCCANVLSDALGLHMVVGHHKGNGQ